VGKKMVLSRCEKRWGEPEQARGRGTRKGDVKPLGIGVEGFRGGGPMGRGIGSQKGPGSGKG